MSELRRLPAEWEPQAALLLAWPWDETLWQPDPSASQRACTAIVQAAAAHQTVLLLVPATDGQLPAALAPGPPRLRTVAVPTNDAWTRDYGPITVLDHEQRPLLLDFGFNGWGLKFAAADDNLVSRRLFDRYRSLFSSTATLETVGLVLEGGSIESDGAGTIMTTAGCLLSPNRNPHLQRADLSALLSRHLGAEQVLWLDYGEIAGDDTDGHIDTLARFAPGGRILHVSCDDPADPHYRPLQQLRRQLGDWRQLNGDPFALLPLPLPAPIFAADGRRLPATYVNFTIINDAVLVPAYDDAADAVAAAVLAEVFPQREIVGVDCRAIIQQGGSLHCLTMQLPEGTLR